jgi:hypothetical protein
LPAHSNLLILLRTNFLQTSARSQIRVWATACKDLTAVNWLPKGIKELGQKISQ